MRGLSYHEIETLEERIRVLQERVGYSGDYDSWIASVTPANARQVNFPTNIAQESACESSAALYCTACR